MKVFTTALLAILPLITPAQPRQDRRVVDAFNERLHGKARDYFDFVYGFEEIQPIQWMPGWEAWVESQCAPNTYATGVCPDAAANLDAYLAQVPRKAHVAEGIITITPMDQPEGCGEQFQATLLPGSAGQTTLLLIHSLPWVGFSDHQSHPPLYTFDQRQKKWKLQEDAFQPINHLRLFFDDPAQADSLAAHACAIADWQILPGGVIELRPSIKFDPCADGYHHSPQRCQLLQQMRTQPIRITWDKRTQRFITTKP